MSRRSKVVLIVLIVAVLLVVISIFNQEPSTEDKLSSWEEEIVDPNNDLNPLELTEENGRLILNIGSKVENVINKIFTIIFGFFEKIIG